MQESEFRTVLTVGKKSQNSPWTRWLITLWIYRREPESSCWHLQFVAEKGLKDAIIANTQGLCTEMEGAAIAQTAYRNKVPFVILRAISDKADDSAEMDYPTFERIAAHRCAEVTCQLAKKLNASG